MRGRIRSVKPELFQDEELWDLAQSSGLPVLQAFAGIWCFSDREGRFEWRPRALGSLILPYWVGEFSAVMTALEREGFIVRYVVDGRTYGYVRNFHKHQAPNHREPPSELPAPTEDDTTRAHPGTPGWSGNGNGNGSGSGEDAREPAPRPVAVPDPVPLPDPVPKTSHDLDRWQEPPGFDAEIVAAGLTRAQFDKRLADLKTGPIGGKRGVFAEKLTQYIRLQLPRWKQWEETDAIKAQDRGFRGKKGPNQPNAGLTGLEIFTRKAG